MLANPVPHRRFVQPKPLGDLGQGHSLTEQLLKRRAIHKPMILTAWDETIERMFAL